MRARILISFALVAAVAFVAVSASRNQPFAPASDLPRDARLYIQVEDLPGLIKLWNASGFKAKYLESQNFKDFSNSHLGLKLASRWQEFSDAVGFPLDLGTLSGLAEKRAALAVYDIGKLDFVFVAPMKKELFEATRFMQNSDKFEEQELDEGTRIYRVNIDADRGRQKQELLFTNVRGRLIIATSEKLLVRTIAIVTGKSSKDSLADEPEFAALKDRLAPRIFSAWVDQKALNDDYYFKHYWLMQNADQLKNLRAGLFSLSISKGEIVEDREFLLSDPVSQDFIPASDMTGLLSRIPDDASFYKIRNVTAENVHDTLQNIVSPADDLAPKNRKRAGYSHIAARYYDYEESYELGENFDRYIDDPETDEGSDRSEVSKDVDFYPILESAGARSVLTLARTRRNRVPLFVDFDRAAVFSLASPAAFDRTGFESAVSRELARHLLIDGQNLDTRWTSKNENGSSWREFDVPMLGYSIAYAAAGNRLIVSNEPLFLTELLQTRARPEFRSPSPAADEYAAIKTLATGQDFKNVFDRLSVDKDDFFAGNIASLIDSASSVDRIEVRSEHSGNIRKKEIKITFH